MAASKSSAYLAVSLVQILSLVCLLEGACVNQADLACDMNIDQPTASSRVPKVFDYGKYVEKFTKSYSPTETLDRARLFFGRTLLIFKHNLLFKRKLVDHYLSQNQFTDMTAEELKVNYMAKGIDMPPVAEALRFPNLPADRLPSVYAFQHGDDYSQASLDELTDDVAVEHKRIPVLNFFDEQGMPELEVALRDIKSKPDVARKFARVVRIRSTKNWNEPSEINNQVKFSPVVVSNNRNYDHGFITSYGMFSSLKETGINYAKALADLPVMSTLSSVANYLDTRDDDFSDLDDLEDDLDDDLIWDTEPEQASTPAPALHRSQIRYDIDWRSSGCITVPKAQMSCNSCYAHATIGLMEYFHCQQTKKLTEFSVQYIIDCGSKSGLGGCSGGKLSQVGQFIKRYGIELNSMYPYTGIQHQCPYDSESDQERKTGYLRPTITHWQHFTDMVAWYKWLPKSPIIVGINMPKDFMGYGGGIHDGADCDPNMAHALLLVGSGVENGKEFWLLRNSYSDSWGEEGYFRLSKGAPLRCFNSAIVARANFKARRI